MDSDTERYEIPVNGNEKLRYMALSKSGKVPLARLTMPAIQTQCRKSINSSMIPGIT